MGAGKPSTFSRTSRGAMAISSRIARVSSASKARGGCQLSMPLTWWFQGGCHRCREREDDGFGEERALRVGAVADAGAGLLVGQEDPLGGGRDEQGCPEDEEVFEHQRS